MLGPAQAQTPYYYLNRKLVPVDCYIAGTPTLADLYAESEELTDTIVGTIDLKTNQTYAIEKKTVISIGYGSAEGAWNPVLNYSGSSSNYPGKIYDNVGWVRGTKSVNGEWSAYLWVIQNQIAFQSSTSRWWTTTNGLQIEITNVMVGTLGDYQAKSNVVDIGPKIPTNFLGANKSEIKQFQVDITNVGYQLFLIPDIWIEPRYAVTNIGGTNIQFTVTGANIPNGVTWSLIPNLSGSGGAKIEANADWHVVEVIPGNIATNYKVRATSVDKTNFYDEVDLTVAKVASIELVSGATASNVIPSNTWVTVKNTNATPEYVVFQAVVDPNVAEVNLPGDFVTWLGGEAVAGHPLQRRVNKQTAAHTPVIATCGETSATGDVWIVWADLEIRMAGTTYQTPNSARFGIIYYDKSENLGARLYDYRDQAGNFISRAAAGKVAPIGKLGPAGINTITTNGWAIRREMIKHDYKDGIVWQQEWYATWTDDTTSYDPFVRFAPDDLNQIYDLDAPNIAKFQGSLGIITNSCERYDHFRQWVTWNGTKCSDYSLWHWYARWKDNTNLDLQIELMDVGVGNPVFPSPAPYYSPP